MHFQHYLLDLSVVVVHVASVMVEMLNLKVFLVTRVLVLLLVRVVQLTEFC